MSPARKAEAAKAAPVALDAADISRVIEMAWEDRTSFEAIEQQFGLNEAAVIALMRRAVAIVEARSQDPRQRIRYNANWGVSLLDVGRPGEAMGVFRRAQPDTDIVPFFPRDAAGERLDHFGHDVLGQHPAEGFDASAGTLGSGNTKLPAKSPQGVDA